MTQYGIETLECGKCTQALSCGSTFYSKECPIHWEDKKAKDEEWQALIQQLAKEVLP